MEKILFIFSLFIPSTGISILLLSLTFSIFTLPIQSRFKKMEFHISNKMKLIDIEIKKIDKNLKGEERFLAIDRIYKKNDEDLQKRTQRDFAEQNSSLISTM